MCTTRLEHREPLVRVCVSLSFKRGFANDNLYSLKCVLLVFMASCVSCVARLYCKTFSDAYFVVMVLGFTIPSIMAAPRPISLDHFGKYGGCNPASARENGEMQTKIVALPYPDLTGGSRSNWIGSCLFGKLHI